MNTTKNVSGRFLLVVASSFFFLPIASAQVTFTIFTDPHPTVGAVTAALTGSNGFAFAGDKFVGSIAKNGLGVLYSTDLLGSNVQLFAAAVNVPVSAWANEHPVASSLGLGGFPSRDIYVGAGNGVMHFTHDGTNSNMFVAGLASDVTALRFDAVGTFGNDLLVATMQGQIYRVSSAGVPTLVGLALGTVEGLDVVPLGAKFGSFDGQIIATVEGEPYGLLQTMDWSGKATFLKQTKAIMYAESINFVPLNLGASGTQIEGLYLAVYPPNVIKADGSQFAAFKGDAIVGSEYYGLWRLHWNGTAFETTVLAPNLGQLEDGIFVTPNMIDPPLGGSCPTKDKKHDGDDHETDGPHI